MNCINSPPVRYSTRIVMIMMHPKTFCTHLMMQKQSLSSVGACLWERRRERDSHSPSPCCETRVVCEDSGWDGYWSSISKFFPGCRRLCFCIHSLHSFNTYALNTYDVPGAKIQALKPVLCFMDEETASLRDSAVCTCSCVFTEHVNNKAGMQAQMSIDATLLTRNCTDFCKPWHTLLM